MHKTSENYKKLIYLDGVKHILKVYIDNVEVEPKYIYDFNTGYELFSSNEFCFGGVASRSIDLKIHKNAFPDNAKEIFIETGIDSEIIPYGYFRIDDFEEKNDYIVSLKCVDDMIKFEFNYDGSSLNYPCTVLNVLKDICKKAGVELRFYFFC